jgi:dextranase
VTAFATAPETAALAAARLTMATIFSHGGFHLLNGEAGAVLTDPYYPKHHQLTSPGVEVMRRWYDFCVRYGDVLYDRDSLDVTRTVLGGINEEYRLTAPVVVSTDAEAGALWVRAVQTAGHTAFHLINLAGQKATDWDAPKHRVQPLRDVTLAVLRTEGEPPAFSYADPDLAPALRPLRSRFEEGYDLVTIPRVGAWTVVLVRRAPVDA